MPRRQLGQNFLVDRNTLLRIVATAGVQPGDAVLEVGTGLGVLTQELAVAVGPAGSVVTVEFDPRLYPILNDTLSGKSNVTLIKGDVLRVDLMSALSVSPTSTGRHLVVANIPYQITSPLIELLLALPQSFDQIVLLVQKEVAHRLAAKPGTGDYGSFSVFVQYQCDVKVIGTVSPSVFMPQPKVDSAIVRLTPLSTPPVDAGDPTAFFRVVRQSFSQRRKQIANCLSALPELDGTRQAVTHLLDTAGIEPSRRAETLSLEEYARITRTLLARG